MISLVIESWAWLLYFDHLMYFRGFRALRDAVCNRPAMACHAPASNQAICRAVDLACVFYFKRVLCLQRSAVTAVLLRRHGWSARMVIGAQLVPFQSHAWVEIHGEVVNDKPYVTDIFQVLDRC